MNDGSFAVRIGLMLIRLPNRTMELKERPDRSGRSFWCLAILGLWPPGLWWRLRPFSASQPGRGATSPDQTRQAVETRMIAFRAE